MSTAGTFTGTGASLSITPQHSDFSYRLNCSAFTGGPVVWNIGITQEGKASFSLSGSWTATVDLQRSIDKGTTWVDMPDDSYTSNTAKVIE